MRGETFIDASASSNSLAIFPVHQRLRDNLHSGKWTAEEWSTIRNVSIEHIKLEVMLVEAKNSIKGGLLSHNFNDAVVDSFLDSHVQNVWELGYEIRMQIILGVGSAFELSKTRELLFLLVLLVSTTCNNNHNNKRKCQASRS
mmetsp:Transcript_12570/g.22772  ORF Transcript_12570/g.22772 Transcript_12570/m.22772 type:complete len:143 (-) Transcript_12570:620-1048(-)